MCSRNAKEYLQRFCTSLALSVDTPSADQNCFVADSSVLSALQSRVSIVFTTNASQSLPRPSRYGFFCDTHHSSGSRPVGSSEREKRRFSWNLKSDQISLFFLSGEEKQIRFDRNGSIRVLCGRAAHSGSANNVSSAVRLHQPSVASSDERSTAGSDEGRNNSLFGNTQASVSKVEGSSRDFMADVPNFQGKLSRRSANASGSLSPRRHIARFACGRSDGHTNRVKPSYFSR